MCNIAGFYSTDHSTHKQQMALFVRLLLEGSIRGRHATGVMLDRWVTKEPLPADEFVEKHRKLLNKASHHVAIGHNRYDTSGSYINNRNNQPLSNEVSWILAHNGIVSMSEQFPNKFATKCQTENDSEVILKYVMAQKSASPLNAISQAITEIAKVEMPIFACAMMCLLNDKLYLFKDDVRPLHLYFVNELETYVFASTHDIFVRAVGNCFTWVEIPLLPFVVYEVSRDEIRYQQINLTPRVHPQYDRRSRLTLTDRKGYGFQHNGIPAVTKQVDYRINRREAFADYYASIIASWDVDPAYPLLVYLFQRYELSREQEFWACWLYGIFYHVATVHWVLQEFPDFEKVDVERLTKWHDKHWKLLQYETDRRHEKGKFVQAFVAYREWVGNQTQEQKFHSLLVSGDTTGCDSFDSIWKAMVGKLFSFGRYASFYYTEALARCVGLPITPTDIFLKDAESTRNGLCHALKREDLVDNKHLNKDDYEFLTQELISLMTDLRSVYPEMPIDLWYMETALCAYKGLYRRRRYIGYYIDRLYDQVYAIRNLDKTTATLGVDWEPLEDFRQECLEPEYVNQSGIDEVALNAMVEDGLLVRLHPIALREYSLPEHVRGEVKTPPQEYKPVKAQRKSDYAFLAKLNAIELSCPKSEQIYQVMKTRTTK